VAARDVAGNWSSWKYSARFTTLAYDAENAGSSFDSYWRTDRNARDAYRGTLVYTRTPGATTSVSFNTWSIGVVAPLFPRGGTAAVYIDNVLVGTIAQYAAAVTPRRVVFTWLLPDSRVRHVLKIVNRSGETDIDAYVLLDPA
jgi:hypothetical protein